jgi:hypothetical protein
MVVVDRSPIVVPFLVGVYHNVLKLIMNKLGVKPPNGSHIAARYFAGSAGGSVSALPCGR